jgi:hypothetical protein
MLALSVLEVIPTEAPVALGVLLVTAVFAYDPEGDVDAVETESSEQDDVPEDDEYGYPGDEESRAPWL